MQWLHLIHALIICRGVLKTIHGENLYVSALTNPASSESVEVLYDNSSAILLNTEFDSCKNGSVILEVSRMLAEDSLQRALENWQSTMDEIPYIRDPYPEEAYFEQQNRTPAVFVFIIPTVFVVLALIFVIFVNNRTLTFFARDRSAARPAADPENIPEPLEPPPNTSVVPKVRPFPSLLYISIYKSILSLYPYHLF